MQETDTGVIQDPFTPILVGVVTDRHFCLHLVAAGRDPSSTWIDGCVTQGPICSLEQDEVSVALDLRTSDPAAAGGESKTRGRGHVVIWRPGVLGGPRSERDCGGLAEHVRARPHN